MQEAAKAEKAIAALAALARIAFAIMRGETTYREIPA